MPLDAPVTRTVTLLPRQRVREHLLVEAIPVALEPLLGVVLALPPQELDEARVAGLHLGPGRPAMVGQEIAPPVLDRPIDEAPEVPRRLLHRRRVVGGVQVEDDGGVALLGPGQEALVVLLDEADRAVDDVGLPLPEVS